jgi:hypothetical protein
MNAAGSMNLGVSERRSRQTRTMLLSPTRTGVRYGLSVIFPYSEQTSAPLSVQPVGHGAYNPTLFSLHAAEP